jgi:hypothetical protein
MIDTVDKDANSKRSLITDIDQFKEWYLTSNGYFKFPGFSIWPLEKNRFFLISNSEKRVLDAKYFYRPDYLSYDEYGIEILWPIILFVNNCFSREEFDTQEVLIPSLDSIIAVCRDKFGAIDTSEITEVNL